MDDPFEPIPELTLAPVTDPNPRPLSVRYRFRASPEAEWETKEKILETSGEVSYAALEIAGQPICGGAPAQEFTLRAVDAKGLTSPDLPR